MLPETWKPEMHAYTGYFSWLSFNGIDSSSTQDLEFRIRMGIVSDEYTTEYCEAAHEVVDHEADKNVSWAVCGHLEVTVEVGKNQY